jgi:hypothetical protein
MSNFRVNERTALNDVVVGAARVSHWSWRLRATKRFQFVMTRIRTELGAEHLITKADAFNWS